MLRKAIVGVGIGMLLTIGSVGGAFAADPHSGGSTGQPSQTCLSSSAPQTPGNASSSPGSPFNEPVGSSNGGTGGQHYASTSQYDVACFQVSQGH
jgi:hypothetical protein